jgi:Short C-terminal domain
MTVECSISNIGKGGAAVFVAAAILCGCSSTPSIQPVQSSRSEFEGAAYSGEEAIISSGTPGAEQYRVFNQAASGFISIASIRRDAENRAVAFCDRKGKGMNPLRETTAKPPFILGNFPRIEIIFECNEKPGTTGTTATDDPRYAKLISLKKLLDSGVITQEEFDKEKAKILSQP